MKVADKLAIYAAEQRGRQAGLREARDVLQKYGDDRIKAMLDRMDDADDRAMISAATASEEKKPLPDFGATVSEETKQAIKAIEDNSKNAMAKAHTILFGGKPTASDPHAR